MAGLSLNRQRLKTKPSRKNVHASRLNANGSTKRAPSCRLKFKHHSLELVFSKRAKLAEVLREFYAEVQLENARL